MKKASLTAGLRIGDQTQVLKMLQKERITSDDYSAIGKDSDLCDKVVAVIKRHRMFTSPEGQIQRMLEINEMVWKNCRITERAIQEIGDPQECPASSQTELYCIGLFFELGNELYTFQRNWEAALYVHGKGRATKSTALKLDWRHLRSRYNDKRRPIGLRWAVCELGRAYQGLSVQDVRLNLDTSNMMGLGQELPFLAALHPHWANSMNGADIPFVNAPDLAVRLDAKEGFDYAPCLFSYDYDGRKVINLSTFRVESVRPTYGSGWFLR